MIHKSKNRQRLRTNRAFRVRKSIKGTASKPRLSVFKSNCHVQAQLIDDATGTTIGTAATFGKDLRTTQFNKKNKASARKIGELIAEIAKSKNIKEVVFDRGPFKYHGILAELANAAREGGLQF